MKLLYFFESIRTPFGDAFMSLVTHFGEETIFLALALVIFWCVDKYEGYYLILTGFFGTVANQILKMIFRIPRPWVLDKNFTIVESARAEATGYSFPSGHTQSSVGAYGGMARWTKRRAFRIFGIVMAVLVPISRMYLGVHTPKDVGVSALVALVLIFTLYPLAQRVKEKPAVMWKLLAVLTLVTLAGTVFMLAYPFPADTDAANLLSAQENMCKLLGATLGMLVSFYADSRYIHFETEAPRRLQILKVVFGIGLVLAVQTGLKPVLNVIFGASVLRHVIRYFFVVVMAGCVWPMVFMRAKR